VRHLPTNHSPLSSSSAQAFSSSSFPMRHQIRTSKLEAFPRRLYTRRGMYPAVGEVLDVSFPSQLQPVLFEGAPARLSEPAQLLTTVHSCAQVFVRYRLSSFLSQRLSWIAVGSPRGTSVLVGRSGSRLHLRKEWHSSSERCDSRFSGWYYCSPSRRRLSASVTFRLSFLAATGVFTHHIRRAHREGILRSSFEVLGHDYQKPLTSDRR
jgi:hypothetical protein